MTARLSCLLAMVFFAGPALIAQSNACMNIPSFSTWKEGKSFPHRPAPDRAKEVHQAYKKLKLGMTLEQATFLMPQPDWAEESWKGCTWHYATKVASDGQSGKSITVRFGSERTVNGLGEYNLLFSNSPKSSRR